MGLLFAKLWNMFSGNEEHKIVIVGLDNAGKSTILYQFLMNEVVHTSPTLGSNVEEVVYKNIRFMMWDLGGQDSLRQGWNAYYCNTEFVILVIDSTDRDRLHLSKEELWKLLNNEELSKTSILVFANKQDVAGCMTAAEISSELNLTAIKKHKWQIQSCCALTGENLYKGLEWCAQNLKDNRKSFIILFTIIIVTLLTLVFALSTAFRCVVLLAIPKIIITQLRFILLYQVSLLVLSGPLITIQANSQILCELALCSAKISYDITMEKVKEEFRPLLVFVHSFQALINEFTAFYKTMKKFLIDAMNTIKEMHKYIGRKCSNSFLSLFVMIISFGLKIEKFMTNLSNIFKLCEKKLTEIASDCMDLMNVVETSCLTFFDFFPYLNLLCYLVRILVPICNSIYLTGQMCRITGEFTDNLSHYFGGIIDQFKVFIEEVFYVKMNVQYINEHKSNKSESLGKVYKKIVKSVENRFDIIHLGLSTKVLISILVLSWILYSSSAYRRKFLKYDNFDNTYITKELIKIDNKRAVKNLETIFPLYPEEKLKYLTRDSFYLSRDELIVIFKNYLILLLFTFQMISICLLDFLIYSITNIFTNLLNDYAKDNQHIIYIQEADNNESNTLIQSINNATNIEALAPIKSLLECKKNNAFYPLVHKYKLIYTYLLLLCFIYFSRGYFRRTLSLICSFYYPKRKNKRSIALYLTILRTRANIFLFLARGLKQAVFGEKKRLKVNLWQRFLANNPVLNLWLIRLGIIQKKDFCFSCGVPGVVVDKFKLNKSANKLHPCTNQECDSVYCLSCSMNHNFKCIICNSNIIKKHKSLKNLLTIKRKGLDDDSNESEASDSGEEWRPFYLDEPFELDDNFENTENIKLEDFFKQLDNLSKMKEKEEKKFLSFVCTPDTLDAFEPKKLSRFEGVRNRLKRVEQSLSYNHLLTKIGSKFRSSQDYEMKERLLKNDDHDKKRLKKSVYELDKSDSSNNLTTTKPTLEEDAIVNVSLNFLHFFNFQNTDEQILPVYIALVIEWMTNLEFENNEFLDTKKWLPAKEMEKPNLLIESETSAVQAINTENKYQYLIFRKNILSYLTKLRFHLKCNVNGPLYPHETKVCHLSIKTVFGRKNRFKLRWKNLPISQEYMPGFLISLSADESLRKDELFDFKTNSLEVDLKFKRSISLQFYLYYVPSVLFALISYSNFFLPIVVLTGRFLVISIPLVAVLIIYQQVPEFNQLTFIDYWFAFFFHYILSMFAFLLTASREYSNEIFGPNQYQQALMSGTNQTDQQTDEKNKRMAYSNWKKHLKEQTEQRTSSLVSISSLKTDQIARFFYPSLLIIFLLFYFILVLLIKK